mgnify:CR=1 FL=1|tara:strand:- start:2100 stop:2414 length:315 start_codon:yes stop_codon:yes gene_type:complete
MSEPQSKQSKRKRKAATNAIREIKKEQKSTSTIIPTAPFQRLVQEISQDYKTDLRIKSEAYKALQDAAEAHLIDLFSRSNKCAIHENRETIQTKDLRLARELYN